MGYSLENTAPVRIFTGNFGPGTLPAAGGEGIPCNDGESYAFSVTDSPVTMLVKIIGDTGGDDVSDDNDCHCDTKIDYIELLNFAVYFNDVEVPLQFPDLKISGTALCPNIPDGHLIAGDREFGGDVEANGTITIRVADDNSTLMADVSLHMIEIE